MPKPPPLLRPDQIQAAADLIARLDTNPILVAPTGSGKTVMGSNLCNRLKRRVLWVAHRRELISQADAHLRVVGCRDFIATSVQKQARHPLPEGVGLVVIDEAHHCTAGSQYDHLFQYGVPVVGLTATPFRLDGRGLGDLFGSLVIAATVPELVARGYLQEPVIYSHSAPDMTGVASLGGDFNRKEAQNRACKPVLMADIVDTWLRRAKGLKTLVFATGIKHSMDIVGQFKAAGIRAEHVDGGTPTGDRDAILHRLTCGITQVVSNVGIATEGFDLPDLDCAIFARPTASLCLWLQMIGRIMRPQGRCIALDHSGNARRHGSPMRAIEYSLHSGAKTPEGGPGLRMCPDCYLMVKTGVWTCPDCGCDMSPTARVQVKQSSGELVLFEDKREVWEQTENPALYKNMFGHWPIVLEGKLIEPTEANKMLVYEVLVRMGREKGRKQGWASHAYRGIYGKWPVGKVREVRAKVAIEEAFRKGAG